MGTGESRSDLQYEDQYPDQLRRRTRSKQWTNSDFERENPFRSVCNAWSCKLCLIVSLLAALVAFGYGLMAPGGSTALLGRDLETSTLFYSLAAFSLLLFAVAACGVMELACFGGRKTVVEEIADGCHTLCGCCANSVAAMCGCCGFFRANTNSHNPGPKKADTTLATMRDAQAPEAHVGWFKTHTVGCLRTFFFSPLLPHDVSEEGGDDSDCPDV